MDLITEIKNRMGDQLISLIYRDRIRTIRTRSYQLNAPVRSVPVEVMHTLLGIELKIGKKRLLCPDLSTARYLAVFARLGVAQIAVPYNITQISKLADDLESSWYKMLMLAEHLAAERSERLRRRVRSDLIKDQRNEIIALGAGPAIPDFNQNTKQRRPKT
jgi:deoxycytidylate deaminase